MTVDARFYASSESALMPRERRDLISDLYHGALARAPEERGAFLTEACNGDEALRQEVESLLDVRVGVGAVPRAPGRRRRRGWRRV